MTTTRPAVERQHPPDALLRLVNPMMRWLIARGRFGDQLLMLHYLGRKTGRRYDVPAGYHMIDGTVGVFTNSGWRHNFVGGRDIEVTLRGRREPARAVLVNRPAEIAKLYDRLISELGVKRAARRLGLRLNVDRAPTQSELEHAARRSGLSMVRIDRAPGNDDGP